MRVNIFRAQLSKKERKNEHLQVKWVERTRAE